jgi:hypothetical protein
MALCDECWWPVCGPDEEIKELMNQNDMDRYFWRTGQRRSGDDRPNKKGRRLTSREIVLLAAVFCVTVVMLLLVR